MKQLPICFDETRTSEATTRRDSAIIGAPLRGLEMTQDAAVRAVAALSRLFRRREEKDR